MNMKFRLNLFLFMLIFGCKLLAQDRIVTKDGNTLDVYNVEVASNFVFYSEQNSSDADILKMKKDDILMIRFQDGSRKIFTDGAAEESEMEENKVALSEESIVKDYSIPAEENEKLKEKYRVPVEYVKKPSSKEAKSFYCQFDFCKDAVLADKNLEIELKTINVGLTASLYKSVVNADNQQNKYCSAISLSLSITLKNKTSNIIYIDLGNSFFVRGSQSSPFYKPSSTYVTNSSGNSLGFNMGGITNSLGVGGVVGALANATTVGGEKSESSTTVTHSQRFISIPPMSSVILDPQLIFTPGENSYNINVSRCETYKDRGVCVYLKGTGLKRGEFISWDESSSPVNIQLYINYSLDSEFRDVGQIRTSLYAKTMIGVPKLAGGYIYPTIDVSCLSENFIRSLFFTGGFSKY